MTETGGRGDRLLLVLYASFFAALTGAVLAQALAPAMLRVPPAGIDWARWVNVGLWSVLAIGLGRVDQRTVLWRAALFFLAAELLARGPGLIGTEAPQALALALMLAGVALACAGFAGLVPRQRRLRRQPVGGLSRW